MSSLGQPFNLNMWINENRDVLRPPVGNKVIWSDSRMMVMVIGGPNHRNDFHINPTEEFFYQLQGSMVLELMDENGERCDVRLQEGDVFLVPPMVPHGPRRKDNTIGLVVEYWRPEGENDHFVWYCDNCNHLLNDAQFYLTALDVDIKPEFERFYASEELRTCDKCGTVKGVPQARDDF